VHILSAHVALLQEVSFIQWTKKKTAHQTLKSFEPKTSPVFDTVRHVGAAQYTKIAVPAYFEV
jgi:hypothetical protein